MFLAVIKSIDPSLVDMRKALLRSARENLEEAFRIAHFGLGIPRLLEPEGNEKNHCSYVLVWWWSYDEINPRIANAKPLSILFLNICFQLHVSLPPRRDYQLTR